MKKYKTSCGGSQSTKSGHTVSLISFIKRIGYFVLVVISANSFAQDAKTDSLLQVVGRGKNDTLTVNALLNLATTKFQSAPDTALKYAEKAKEIASVIKFKRGEAYAYKWLGIINNAKGNYYEALVNSNFSLTIFQSLKDKTGMSNLLNNLGAFYADKDENSKAVEYYLKALDLAQQTGDKLRMESTLGNIGVIYSKNPATSDSALSFYLKALPYALTIKDDESTGILYTNIGEVYAAKKDFAKAHAYYNKAVQTLGTSLTLVYTFNDVGKLYMQKKMYDSAALYFDKAYAMAEQNDSPVDVMQSLIGKGRLQIELGNTATAIQLFNKALAIGKPMESTPELKDIYEGLSMAHKKMGDYKNAFQFQASLNDLYNTVNERKLNFNTAILEYTMDLQKKSGRIDMLIKENKLQGVNLENEKFARNAALSALGVLLIVAIMLVLNINQRKKLNRLLSIQKEQIEVQKGNVEKALADLKATQSQLIQSEKMASLGELSAGIAHEIQNPLNFVNNFSEVSAEMIDEMEESLQNNDGEGAVLLAADIKENLKKILHHGKRAEGIVKGMLQHFRMGTGKKESTDLNALVDEYLKLSYHGLRAKDKSFNTSFKTYYDENLAQIHLVPQDFSRVLLNLFTNAFYTVNEKKGKLNGTYEPLVSVYTKRKNNTAEIIVEDNGNGISPAIIDKVFQPFFTTKPTGQGTGLGLSLSYDIIKAHGGTIKVESVEGKGSSFIIQLPILSS